MSGNESDAQSLIQHPSGGSSKWWQRRLRPRDGLKEVPLQDLDESGQRKETLTSYESVKDSLMEEKEAKPRGLKIRNWAHGVSICAKIALCILVLNIILTVIAGGLASAHSGDFISATVYQGKCSSTKRFTAGIHLLINLLSTILLAASSYCIQGLAAPSRKDVDKAHEQRKWLDIGVSSLKNIRAMDPSRMILVGVLLLTSTPIHLIYNSAIFSAISINDSPVVIASPDTDFTKAVLPDDLTTCWSNLTGQPLSKFSQQISQGQYKNLTPAQCDANFKEEFATGRGIIVVLADYAEYGLDSDTIFWGTVFQPSEGGDIVTQPINPQNTAWDVAVYNWTKIPILDVHVPLNGAMVTLHEADDWLNSFINAESIPDDFLNDIIDLETIISSPTWTSSRFQQELDNSTLWKNATWASEVTFQFHGMKCPDSTLDDFHVLDTEGCLILDGEEGCQVMFSPIICLLVILCNAIKLICMLLASKRARSEVFLTLGDAVASFLDRPDRHTHGNCLLSRATITDWSRPSDGNASFMALGNQPRALPPTGRWFRAVDTWNWAWISVISLTIIIGASIWTRAGLSLVSYWDELPAPSLMEMGFGQLTWASIIAPSQHKIFPILGMVALANTPQLILSITYFISNRVLTWMVLAAEYDSYSIRRKSLRVSWPCGTQRSSYFLSLPYTYSLPMLIASVVLHWLASQAFFFVLILENTPNSHSERSQNVYYRTVAWSPIALICVICLQFVVFVAILAVGCRRMQGRMPIASSCSAAISAACHPPEDDRAASTQPVRWGEVQNESHEMDERGYPHCSFTSTDVVAPDPKKLYI